MGVRQRGDAPAHAGGDGDRIARRLPRHPDQRRRLAVGGGAGEVLTQARFDAGDIT